MNVNTIGVSISIAILIDWLLNQMIDILNIKLFILNNEINLIVLAAIIYVIIYLRKDKATSILMK